MAKATHSPDLTADLEGLLDGEPGVTARRTFGCPAWYVGGKLFVCVSRDRVVLKLPPAEIEALLESGAGATFGRPGRVMRGWVTVPAVNPAQVRRALRFVATQSATAKPKAPRGRRK